MAGAGHCPRGLAAPAHSAPHPLAPGGTRRPNVYKEACARACMALRHVKPLPPEAWEDFMAALERGPTPEQVRAKERAIELTRHMFPPEDGDCREERDLPRTPVRPCGARPGAGPGRGSP